VKTKILIWICGLQWHTQGGQRGPGSDPRSLTGLSQGSTSPRAEPTAQPRNPQRHASLRERRSEALGCSARKRQRRSAAGQQNSGPGREGGGNPETPALGGTRAQRKQRLDRPVGPKPHLDHTLPPRNEPSAHRLLYRSLPKPVTSAMPPGISPEPAPSRDPTVTELLLFLPLAEGTPPNTPKMFNETLHAANSESQPTP